MTGVYLLLAVLFSNISNGKYFDNKQKAIDFASNVVVKIWTDLFNSDKANRDDWMWNTWTDDALHCVQGDSCDNGIDSIYSTWSPFVKMVQHVDATSNFISYSDNGLSLQLILHHKYFDNSICIGTCQGIIYLNDDGKMTQNHWICQHEFWNCFENTMKRYLKSQQNQLPYGLNK